MTDKVTLSSLANLQNQTTATTTINSNFSTVETAFNNTLSRDGTSPNTMGASLDMNSNHIINLPQPAGNNEPIRLIDLVALSGGGVIGPVSATDGHVVLFNGNTGYSIKDGGSTLAAPALSTTVNNSVTNAYLAQSPANTIKGNATGSTANVSDLTVLPTAVMPALTGDVTNTAGSLATTIQPAVVTGTKIATNTVANTNLSQVPANTIKGNATGSPANVSDLTVLPTAVMPALTGDVTNSAGSLATTIPANTVTNAKSAQMAALTFKGNNTTSTANAADLTASQLRTATGLDNTCFRNIIGMAGGFEVWQRGAGNTASIAVAASTTAYTADRWYITTGANQASTISAQTGLTNGSRLAGRVQRNNAQTGTTAMTFGIPLSTEEIYRLQGSNIAISFTVSTGANWSPTSGTLLATFYVGTGAEGKRGGGFTGEVNVVSSSNNLSTSASATRFTAVSSGTVATTMTQGELQFTWTPTGTASTNDWFQLDDVQIEAVPSANALATVFERWSFEENLNHCRRHYWKSFLYGTAPTQSAGTNTGEVLAVAGRAGALQQLLWVRYPMQLRSSPTITLYNPSAANAQIRDETAGGDTSGASVTANTSEGIFVIATGNASTTVGAILGVHITADASL